VTKQKSIQVNPHETVTIINTIGECNISLFFRTEADYDDNRKTWKNFWIEHDMPVDIYSIGILSNTEFFPGFVKKEKYVVFESLYIEELMKITRDSDGCFIFVYLIVFYEIINL
jgi:hypothetical protein